MNRLDLMLITAFIPVICLTFLIIFEAYASFASRARSRAFQKYTSSFAQSSVSVKHAEDVLSGRRHA